jgi:hypothetical protein
LLDRVIHHHAEKLDLTDRRVSIANGSLTPPTLRPPPEIVLNMLQGQNSTIANLRAEVAQLKSKPTQLAPAPKPAAQLQLTLAIKSATPAAATGARFTSMIYNPEKPASEMSDLDKLRTQLNSEKDQTKRTALYKQIKILETTRSYRIPASGSAAHKTRLSDGVPLVRVHYLIENRRLPSSIKLESADTLTGTT